MIKVSTPMNGWQAVRGGNHRDYRDSIANQYPLCNNSKVSTLTRAKDACREATL